MEFSTYALLQAAIADKLERADLTDAITGFITLAETELNRRVKSRERIERVDVSINAEFVAVPARFRGVRSFKLDGYNRLTPMPEQEMAERKDVTDATGRPKNYCVVGDNFEFYPSPDTTYVGKLTYRTALVPLSDDDPSNWLLASHPDAYFYGALKHAGPYLKDDGELATASALFEAALRDIDTDDREQSYGDNPALRRKSLG